MFDLLVMFDLGECSHDFLITYHSSINICYLLGFLHLVGYVVVFVADDCSSELLDGFSSSWIIILLVCIYSLSLFRAVLHFFKFLEDNSLIFYFELSNNICSCLILTMH